MDPFLPIIMLVLGGLGIACLVWVLLVGFRRQAPEQQIPPPKRLYVPPSNDEDVTRLVAALQETTHRDARKDDEPSLGSH